MRRVVLSIFLLLLSAAAQTRVDQEFSFRFDVLAPTHGTRVLIDAWHPTIYSGTDRSRKDLGIADMLETDGFQVGFLEQPINRELLDDAVDVLLVVGLKVRDGKTLQQHELDSLIQWITNGGSLLLVVGHHPNGVGAIPLMKALGINYRDGYAHLPGLPGEKHKSRCSHFLMSVENNLIRPHSITKSDGPEVSRVEFLCGTGMLRHPDDVVLALPPQTRIYYHVGHTLELEERERGDDYAGMLAFDFGQGRVAVASDRGIFRHLIKKFKGRDIAVTMNNPENDNAALFVNTMRWLGRLD